MLVGEHTKIKPNFSGFYDPDLLLIQRRPSASPLSELWRFHVAWLPSASGKAHTIGGFDRRCRSARIAYISCTSAFGIPPRIYTVAARESKHFRHVMFEFS